VHWLAGQLASPPLVGRVPTGTDAGQLYDDSPRLCRGEVELFPCGDTVVSTVSPSVETMGRMQVCGAYATPIVPGHRGCGRSGAPANGSARRQRHRAIRIAKGAVLVPTALCAADPPWLPPRDLDTV